MGHNPPPLTALSNHMKLRYITLAICSKSHHNKKPLPTTIDVASAEDFAKGLFCIVNLANCIYCIPYRDYIYVQMTSNSISM